MGKREGKRRESVSELTIKAADYGVHALTLQSIEGQSWWPLPLGRSLPPPTPSRLVGEPK